jgi:hypothetical protein
MITVGAHTSHCDTDTIYNCPLCSKPADLNTIHCDKCLMRIRIWGWENILLTSIRTNNSWLWMSNCTKYARTGWRWIYHRQFRVGIRSSSPWRVAPFTCRLCCDDLLYNTSAMHMTTNTKPDSSRAATPNTNSELPMIYPPSTSSSIFSAVKRTVVYSICVAMGGIGTYGYHPLIVYFCATISSRVFNLWLVWCWFW